MRVVFLLLVGAWFAPVLEAQAYATPWMFHAMVKTGVAAPRAKIEIGDPERGAAGYYLLADVAYALPSTYRGANIPPYGQLLLYPPYIFWIRYQMSLVKEGLSSGMYWTYVMAGFPRLPTALRGMKFHVQALAYKHWNSKTIVRFTTRDTLLFY